uniref:Tic22 family protein n=1 Tax=Trichocoleus desertorum TaxID=1481672 RepID=UPI0025B5B1C3|nr:Tic22 family protein [Trichocoleus desertorum]
MKSFVRWSAVLGLVGGALLGPSIAGDMAALALPKEQVLQKLRAVPMFTIADAQGAPLVASAPNAANGQKNTPVAGVFVSQQDAQAFLNNLKTKNPDLAKNVKVMPVSLAEVYELSLANKNKPDGLTFAFVPTQQQVASAVALLKQSGQKVERFNGVPLFIARGGKNKGYLTVKRGNQQIIPLFLKKEELQNMVQRLNQQQPDLAASVDIQVVNLEGVIQTLTDSNNKELEEVAIVAPQESIEFLRSLQPAQGQARPAAK